MSTCITGVLRSGFGHVCVELLELYTCKILRGLAVV